MRGPLHRRTTNSLRNFVTKSRRILMLHVRAHITRHDGSPDPCKNNCSSVSKRRSNFSLRYLHLFKTYRLRTRIAFVQDSKMRVSNSNFLERIRYPNIRQQKSSLYLRSAAFESRLNLPASTTRPVMFSLSVALEMILSSTGLSVTKRNTRTSCFCPMRCARSWVSEMNRRRREVDSGREGRTGDKV